MFDRNFILPDQALREPVEFDVANFFESIKCPLELLRIQPADGGPSMPIAQLLEKIAWKYRLDVRVLLTKLQVEQSLLTQSPTSDRLDWAMGFGATDSGRLESYRGFARQVENAAQTLVGYLDSRHPFSVVDLVGKPMTVSDGVVVPKTMATAALYRYTPWIGDEPSQGLQPPFGNYLFYKVWSQFFGLEPQQTISSRDSDAWRVIVPPDNWRSPLTIPTSSVATWKQAAQRLGLVVQEDSARQKLYLGPAPPVSLQAAPPPARPKSLEEVLYPSGRRLPKVTETSLGAEADRYLPAHPAQAAWLVRAEPEVQLSEHFKLGEFMPKDASYRYLRLAPALVILLEQIRSELGGHPLQVTSAYRPPAYNAMVGGVPDSAHLDGLAADIVSLAVPFERLAAVCDRVVGDRGGVGIYYGSQFVHVDLRGERARW